MSESKARRPAPAPPASTAATPVSTAAAPVSTAAAQASISRAAASAAADTTSAVPPVPQPAEIPAMAHRRSAAAGEELLAFGHTALLAVVESQAAMARGFEAMAKEMTGIARTGLAAASDGAEALLGARSFADAVEAQLGFARRSCDAWIGGTVKLTEIGLRAANEASRPMLSRLADPAVLRAR